MEKKSFFLVLAIGIASFLGIRYLYRKTYVNRRKSANDKEIKKVRIDNLDMQEVVQWFKANIPKSDSGKYQAILVNLLSKNDESQSFRNIIDIDLDGEIHAHLQCFFDDKQELIDADKSRIIASSTISKDITELFGNKSLIIFK